MNEELEIVLRNREGETLSTYFSIHSSSIAQKWKEHLIRTLNSSHHLEKNYCFLGFLESARSIPLLAKELNALTKKISSFVGEGPWKYGYQISETLPESGDIFSALHALHHHFEKLIGQSWSVSPYYSCAPHEIRILIHHLNYLVHEIEALKHSEIARQEKGVYYPYSVVSFPDSPVKPKLFSDEDYDFFSLNRPFGSLNLHYAQTGKAYLDAWRDGDQHIGKNNINSLRYVSGQFDINWGDGPNESEKILRKMYSGFFDWIQKQGFSTENIHYFIDKNGQKQGLGFVEVARMKEEQLALGIAHWQKTVSQFNDIYAIRVHEKEKTTEKIYEYRMKDLGLGDRD